MALNGALIKFYYNQCFTSPPKHIFGSKYIPEMSVFFFALGLLEASLSALVCGTGARKAVRVELWLR